MIGHGAKITTSALPAGRIRVTLSARDYSGRTASASVLVTVPPSPPVLTLLRAPHRVSRTARFVTLRVASLALAVLSVGRQHVLIGRHIRNVRVRIQPGRRLLALILTLRSGRFTASLLVSVPRR